jgi:hypothetical protein
MPADYHAAGAAPMRARVRRLMRRRSSSLLHIATADSESSAANKRLHARRKFFTIVSRSEVAQPLDGLVI